MSFSFNGEPQILEDAIDYAANHKVLMFAAAANNKFNDLEFPIGFPARLGDGVICINAHAPNDEPSHSSPREYKGRANFALPGQGITTIGLGGQRVVKKGSSCATPIAAGIAALVLDFNARMRADMDMAGGYTGDSQNVLETWDGERNLLRDTKIMKSVMLDLMVEPPGNLDGSYNCVKPWKLFKQSSADVISKLKEKVKRKNQNTILH